MQACPTTWLHRGLRANRYKKALNVSRVLVLGFAYKKDIDDLRESPACIVELVLKSGPHFAPSIAVEMKDNCAERHGSTPSAIGLAVASEAACIAPLQL